MRINSLDGTLPVEIIFNPRWWNKNCNITFDKGFFIDPVRRVNDEQKMRTYLYERFGDIGLGEKNSGEKPVMGPVHLAAGYIVSQLLGCEIRFNECDPPDVIAANMTDQEVMGLEAPDIFEAGTTRELINMMNELEDRYGYLVGDVNWSGVQNIALDLRGQQLFIDYYENHELVEHLFEIISKTLVEFVTYIRKRTGSSSISVNPSVRHFGPSVNLHSNCSVAMISNEFYEKFLLKYDNFLSANLQPYGIHHCGDNMDRVAEGYSKVNGVEFFDVGWGSDIRKCRELLPDAFFNLRLNPVKILTCSDNEVEEDIIKLVENNGGIRNAGICCINMDNGTPDINIKKVFDTAKLCCS
ncbi:MAG: hypothetical protein FIA99_14060 [Ruminiclostridium sp.]|nr:hypothetical protein [Ruminiclostridium sp.]